MIIEQKPIKAKVTHNICPFHKKHPFERYAGCTCSSSYEAIVDEEKLKKQRKMEHLIHG